MNQGDRYTVAVDSMGPLFRAVAGADVFDLTPQNTPSPTSTNLVTGRYGRRVHPVEG
jgi:hypothetical protein